MVIQLKVERCCAAISKGNSWCFFTHVFHATTWCIISFRCIFITNCTLACRSPPGVLVHYGWHWSVSLGNWSTKFTSCNVNSPNQIRLVIILQIKIFFFFVLGFFASITNPQYCLSRKWLLHHPVHKCPWSAIPTWVGFSAVSFHFAYFP